MSEDKTEMLSLRVTPELKKKLEKLANDENRSASAQAAQLIEEGLFAHSAKAREFIGFVQTMIITNAINLASDPKTAKAFRTEISVTGTSATLSDAIEAARRIP
ncbi:MAG: hypothetical protein ABL897_08415, partial [Hyphomicrobium sp.]